MTATLTEPVTAEAYTGPVRFDLIDQQIAWAESESKKGAKGKWDQNNWGITKPSCGTAFCVAGHVAALAGYVPYQRYKSTDPELVKPGRTFAWFESWENVFAPDDKVRDEDETALGTAEVGEQLLGIGHLRWMHSDLFNGSNTIQRLKEIRDEYADVEGYPRKYDA